VEWSYPIIPVHVYIHFGVFMIFTNREMATIHHNKLSHPEVVNGQPPQQQVDEYGDWWRMLSRDLPERGKGITSRRKEKEEYLYICESSANSNISFSSSSSSFTGRLCVWLIVLSLCVWLIVWVSSVWFIVIEEEDWSVSIGFLTFLLFLWKENGHLLDKLPFTALNSRGIDFNR